MNKHIFYAEAAYFSGLILLALGTALTAHGGFGISMVVAPAYILHLKLSQYWAFFTFGVAEYTFQAVLLLLMILLLRKVKLPFFLSILTAVLYGVLLDGAVLLVGLLPAGGIAFRLVTYISGVLICAAAISLLFRSYFPPEVYEMFVKEFATKLKKPFPVVKTVYDCCSLLLSILLSLLFWKGFHGIGIGTVVCAFLNGTLIRSFSILFDKLFAFRDRFPLRKFLEESEAVL